MEEQLLQVGDNINIMMKEKDDDEMMMRSHADAVKDDIKDDSSTTSSTEAPSTAATDIDEYTHIIPREAPSTSFIHTFSYPTLSTLAILVAILSVLAAANPSFFTSYCGKHITSFFTWYLTTLAAAPLFTKCVTGSLFALVGDYCAQWFEYKPHDGQQHHKHDCSSFLQNIISLLSIHGMYDYRRGRAIVLESLLISCPLQHYAYDLFESILPVEGGSELYRSFAAMVHVFLDNVALDGIFVASGILFGGIFEGHSLTSYVLPKLRSTFIAALRAALLINLSFVPFEFLSFRFLPLPLRVLSVNAVDLVWIGVVSFASHGGAALENASA